MYLLIQSSERYEVDSVIVCTPQETEVHCQYVSEPGFSGASVLTTVLYCSEELREGVRTGAACLEVVRIR